MREGLGDEECDGTFAMTRYIKRMVSRSCS